MTVVEWCQRMESLSRQQGCYADMMLDFIVAETDRLSDMARQSLAPDVWDACRADVYDRVYRALGLHRLPTPAEPVGHVIGVTDMGAYRVEKIVLNSIGGYPIPGLLYVPNKSECAPAVLYSVGHWMTQSKAEPMVQAACIRLVMNGFVVLVIDPIGQGERVPKFEDHARRDLIPLGLVQEGLTVWEHMRAIDYLAAQSEVDASRIGMTGASGGGLTTFLTTALDSRIRAAVSVCYVSSYSKFLRSVRGTNWDGVEDLCNQIPGIISIADAAGIAGLIAPRPLLMINGLQDPHFTVDGAREVLEQSAALFPEPDSVRVTAVDADHGYDEEMQRAAIGWFLKWLAGKGAGASIADPAIDLQSADSLTVQSLSGNTASFSTGIDDLVRMELERIALERLTTPKQLDASTVRLVLGWDLVPRTKTQTMGDVVLRDTIDGLVCERHEVVSEQGIVVPMHVLHAETAHRDALVIYLDDAGKSAGHFPSLAELTCALGATLVGLDPRGIGETAPVPPPLVTMSTLEGPLEYVQPGPDEHLEFEAATDSLMLGRSLLGQQVYDILRCVDYLGSVGTRNSPIAVVGRGAQSSLQLLLAAVLDERISCLFLEGLPSSCADLVRFRHKFPISAYVFDMMRHFDIPDLLEQLRLRRTFLFDPIDGESPVAKTDRWYQTIAPIQERTKRAGGELSVHMGQSLSLLMVNEVLDAT